MSKQEAQRLGEELCGLIHPNTPNADAIRFGEVLARLVALATDTASVGVAEGWVLVPKEPTEDMLSRGLGEILCIEPITADIANCWRAMIAAAPLEAAQAKEK